MSRDMEHLQIRCWTESDDAQRKYQVMLAISGLRSEQVANAVGAWLRSTLEENVQEIAETVATAASNERPPGRTQ